MARRRRWDEMSPQEKRQGCGCLIGAFVILVIIGAIASAGGDSTKPTAAAASAAATTSPPASPAAALVWYDGTTELRGQIATSAAAVRQHIAAQDGASLRPACQALAALAQTARDYPAAPDAETQQAFHVGAGYYADAAQWCDKIWTGGGAVTLTVLWERTTNALGNGDERWQELARRVGGTVATAAPATTASRPQATAAAPAATTPTRTTSTPRPASIAPRPPTPAPATTASSVYYRNCDAARAAGAAPIYQGQPGYRAALDANHDGVACETR
ncbi:excalibur calcium-binding domain-containing protein [Protofrankia coriariae]|uniref:excalibur calcium-binding domain-containing protein n=1 Tax=Protofrankia coriariae TaxID=1562887 RepID=UPI000AF5DEBA|nr:excalibur calcium-binding domain-containing protein [Protofrankia coriariae]